MTVTTWLRWEGIPPISAGKIKSTRRRPPNLPAARKFPLAFLSSLAVGGINTRFHSTASSTMAEHRFLNLRRLAANDQLRGLVAALEAAGFQVVDHLLDNGIVVHHKGVRSLHFNVILHSLEARAFDRNLAVISARNHG